MNITVRLEDVEALRGGSAEAEVPDEALTRSPEFIAERYLLPAVLAAWDALRALPQKPDTES